VAREHARELSLDGAAIEFRLLNGEWIDLEVASVDRVLCRWGYMLMADPAVALGETRRVLRSGGRIALAVWDAIERNPWAALPGIELRERGLTAPPAPGTPGPFALGDEARVRELLQAAGFEDVRVDVLDLHRRHGSFDEFWETTLDLSRAFHDAVLARPQDEIDEIQAAVRTRLAPFEGPGGVLDIPARTLAASASA
jgi:SAM-dependent methyltransferase